MRKAADLLRERVDAIAPLLTLEQGKLLPEARGEVLAAADVIDWFAEACIADLRRGLRAIRASWCSWSPTSSVGWRWKASAVRR